MIKPRFISGHAVPHYAGSRPGLFIAVVKLFTDPTRSTYLENVRDKLLEFFKGVPLITLNHVSRSDSIQNSRSAGSVIKLNRAGATSVVQMAVRFGLLNSNYFWTWKGHTINIISNKKNTTAERFLNLDLAERIALMKYYLEADGAMLSILGERILEFPAGLTTKDLFDSRLVDDIFPTIVRSYLELTRDLGSRTQLRHDLTRLETQQYKPYTRKHKLLPRLIPLEDFDLLHRELGDKGEVFVMSKRDGEIPLKKLVSELGTVGIMEERFARGDYFTIVANTLYDHVNLLSHNNSRRLLCNEIAYAYSRLRSTGIAVYPLNAIEDAVCTRLLANHTLLASPEQVREFLSQTREQRPNDIRFHVDRQGKPAYLILSDALLREWSDNAFEDGNNPTG